MNVFEIVAYMLQRSREADIFYIQWHRRTRKQPFEYCWYKGYQIFGLISGCILASHVIYLRVEKVGLLGCATLPKNLVRCKTFEEKSRTVTLFVFLHVRPIKVRTYSLGDWICSPMMLIMRSCTKREKRKFETRRVCQDRTFYKKSGWARVLDAETLLPHLGRGFLYMSQERLCVLGYYLRPLT